MTRNLPASMAIPRVMLYQGVFAAEAGKGASVVARSGGVGVEDLGQAMRPGISEPGEAPAAHRGPGGKSKDEKDRNEHCHGGGFHIVSFDLFPEVLGSAPDHEPCQKDGEYDKNEHPIEACSDAAKDHLPKLYIEKWDKTSKRGEGIVHEFTAPQEASVVTVAKRAESKIPKRTSFPSMFP